MISLPPPSHTGMNNFIKLLLILFFSIPILANGQSQPAYLQATVFYQVAGNSSADSSGYSIISGLCYFYGLRVVDLNSTGNTIQIYDDVTYASATNGNKQAVLEAIFDTNSTISIVTDKTRFKTSDCPVFIPAVGNPVSYKDGATILGGILVPIQMQKGIVFKTTTGAKQATVIVYYKYF